jgi:hypothetical protein
MRLFCIAIISVLWAWIFQSQSTIAYTVDPDFNTQETLRSETSLFDIYPLEDGGFLGGLVCFSPILIVHFKLE